MSVLEKLQEAEIFKGMSQEQLQKVEPGCEERFYTAEERLFAEGEDAGHFWLITSGRVDLRFDLPGRPSSPESTLLTVGQGEVLGWSSFVPPFQYKLSAYCVSGSCSVVCVRNEFLKDLFLREPGMGYRFISYLAGVASMHYSKLQHSGGEMPAAVVDVTVHMATCGIAAGAREVMLALTDEVGRSDRLDIRVNSGRCIGHCRREPNVTVAVPGEEPVIYEKMTADKMREVFNKHVLAGQVVSEYVLQKD